MPATVEVHKRFSPQQAQQFDLLLDALAAIAEVLVQGAVLDLIPTYPNSQPQASAAEYIQCGGLFGNQSRLALGQDKDAGSKAQLTCDGAHEAEQQERRLEWMLVCIRSFYSVRAFWVDSQDVFVCRYVR